MHPPLKFLRFAAALAICATASFPQSDRAEMQFQAAQKKEVVDGDLRTAIEMYRKIVSDYAGNRPVVARALVALGQCHEKLGSAEARKAYEQVIANYADQADAAAQARARLAGLGGAKRESGFTLRRLDTEGGFVTSVSADGRYFGCDNYDTGDAAIIDTQTGRHWNVTNYGGWREVKGYVDHAVISKDGQWVAFWHYRESTPSYGELRIASADGKTERTLYRAPGGLTEWGIPLDWSPDGKYIATQLIRYGDRPEQAESTIVVVPVDGAPHQIIKKKSGRSAYLNIFFSPNGRYLAYADAPGKGQSAADIFVHDRTSGQETPVAPHDADERVAGWAPDGSLLFLSKRTGVWCLYQISIQEGKQAGELRIVYRDAPDAHPIGLTKSGAFLYGTSLNTTNVYTASIDVSTGKVLERPVMVAPRFPDSTLNGSWSPDGRFLAYVYQPQSDKPSTLMIRRDGESVDRELSPQVNIHGVRSFARWHADGKSMLAMSMKDNKRGLYQIDVQTGQAELLWESSPQSVDWAADGRYVLFVHPDQRSIIRHDIPGGGEKTVYTAGGGTRVQRVSPDGRHLAFLTWGADPKESRVLAVVPSDGGVAKTLAHSRPGGFDFPNMPLTVAWTPDGRHILTARVGTPPSGRTSDAATMDLWCVPVEQGQPRKTELTVRGMIHNLNVHPDGKRIAYTNLGMRYDFWVMENFLPTGK